MTYVQTIKQTNQIFRKQNWKVAFWTLSQNATAFQSFEGSGGVESIAVSTLHESIEKMRQNI